MYMVLLGPPGSGKGTQAKIIKDQAGYSHLSTGDMLRAAVAAQSPLGLRVKDIMAKGELVSDEIVLQLIEDRLKGDAATAPGVIFDGFPRNLAQAQALDKMLNGLGRKIDKAVSIDINPDVLIERITGRRTCKACGAGYHTKFSPPRVGGKCDKCGGELFQRTDDTEQVIRERLRVFDQQTAALKTYYANQGILAPVAGEASPSEVTTGIARAAGLKGLSTAPMTAH
jgi:adenylate kinase